MHQLDIELPALEMKNLGQGQGTEPTEMGKQTLTGFFLGGGENLLLWVLGQANTKDAFFQCNVIRVPDLDQRDLDFQHSHNWASL